MLRENGRGFVWARSLERFVWLGDGSDREDAGKDEPAEGDAEPAPALDQKSIW